MRPDWDEFYLGIAAAVAARGECLRRQVGAVVVKGRSVVSLGYNGAPPGRPSCLLGACPRGQLTYAEAPAGVNYTGTGCNVIHAEANCLLRASWADMQQATMYVSCEPCEQCAPLVEAAGIGRVVWPDGATVFGVGASELPG